MRKAIVVITSMFLLWGCVSMNYAKRYDPAADFGQMKKYAFLPLSDKDKQDTLLLIKNLRFAANNVLQAKGFTQDADNPDFLVAIHAVTETRTDVQQYGYTYSPGFAHDPYYYDPDWRDHHHGYVGPELYEYRSGVNVYEYNVGTMVIDIVKREPRELVWRGTAKGELPDNMTQEVMRTIVSNILRDFPPRSAK